jgi:acyl-CoA thioesterase-1
MSAISLLLLSIFTSFESRGIIKQIQPIRYVAIGDSYTIGEGAGKGESWPELLVKHLNENNVPVELIANPSRTGWTSKMVIDRELDVYDEAKPGFASLMIGVNDWVQGIDAAGFRNNLAFIISQMQLKLADKKNLILITIPDFSASPQGAKYSGGRDIVKGITEFNHIIKEEGAKNGLKVIDIFELSKGMKKDHSLVAKDGLQSGRK